ncbi:MAG: hypothetical protein WDM70_01540 [Nitrosomonadales bacterium]
MRFGKIFLVAIALFFTLSVQAAPDVVRLGNLKFAHYGAVSYMKEIAAKYNLVIEERVFAKGLDILPATIAGEIDIAASALDAAVAGRAVECQFMLWRDLPKVARELSGALI